MSDSINQDKVEEAIGALEALAKSMPRNTATTKEEAMQAQNASTQLFHTPNNSEPSSWAGSTGTDVPDNGAVSNTDADGTDYTEQQVMKSILDKVSKGVALSPAERLLVKGFMDKKDDKKDEDDKDLDFEKAGPDCDYDDKDDKKKDMEKSITETVASSPDIADVFDVSEFLESWSTSVTKGVDSKIDSLTSLVKSLTSLVAAKGEEQARYNTAFAKGMTSIGECVSVTTRRVEAVESAPVGAPRAAQSFAKGAYDGAPATQDDIISKAMNGDRGAYSAILKSLEAGALADKVEPLHVMNYESTGVLSAEARQYLATQE